MTPINNLLIKRLNKKKEENVEISSMAIEIGILIAGAIGGLVTFGSLIIKQLG